MALVEITDSRLWILPSQNLNVVMPVALALLP